MRKIPTSYYRILTDKRTVICGLCILAVVVSGCQPLRKKFTRKKKKDRNAESKFIPVLDPIDYPVPEHSPEKDYRRHYSLWRIWDRDLVQSIDNDDSDKRQKYLFAKYLGELENMGSLLGEQQRTEFDAVMEVLRVVQNEYEKPTVMRNSFSVKKKITTSSKQIRNTYAPDLIFTDQ